MAAAGAQQQQRPAAETCCCCSMLFTTAVSASLLFCCFLCLLCCSVSAALLCPAVPCCLLCCCIGCCSLCVAAALSAADVSRCCLRSRPREVRKKSLPVSPHNFTELSISLPAAVGALEIVHLWEGLQRTDPVYYWIRVTCRGKSHSQPFVP